jgi:hypothetical protein
MTRAQHAPGNCPGVSVWYRGRGVECPPTGEDRIGRFALQFYFPGFEQLQADWDRLALAQRVSVDLYVQDSPDGLFATAEGLEIQSEGSWVEADLPSSSSTVWAVMRSDAPGGWSSRTPAWEIPLYDAAFGLVDTREGVCLVHECLDVEKLALSPSDLASLHLEMPVPLLALGESGHGVEPRSVRKIAGEILVNDNLHGQDFLPRRMSDPWVLIDVATANDRVQNSFLLYPDSSGGFAVGPLEMVTYYEGATGPLVVRYDAHAETRRGDEGYALLGALPAGVPLGEVFLVMGNTGPAWRLK